MRKELTVDKWFEELKSGLEYRKLYGREAAWHELEALFYEAKNLGPARGPNLISSIGDSTVSQLGSLYPYMMVKPKRQDLVEQARLLESVDNTLLEDLDLTGVVEQAILHAFLWGRGILKIGYDSEWGWNPLGLSREEQLFGVSFSQFDRKGNRIEYNDRVKPGMPWVSTVLPHDFIVPWGVCEIADAPWVAHRVIRHIDDIKADDKYENKRDLQPVMSAEDFVKSYTMPYDLDRVGAPRITSDVKAEYCELFEIRDGRTGKILVVATGHDKFLRNEADGLQVRGLPFVSFGLIPSTRSFWVTPDALYLLPYQVELNDISSQTRLQRKASILKFLFSADAFSPEEKAKIFNGDVGVGIEVKGGIPITEAVKDFTPYNMNAMVFANDGEYIRRNARETVGFSRNQLGEYEHRGRRTASEVMAVQEGASVKMGRRQGRMRRTYIDLFEKINHILFSYWRGPKWVDVGGDWMQVTGPMLHGDYSYGVAFAQGRPVDDPVMRQSEAIAIYQALAQDPNADQVEIRENVRRSMVRPEMGKGFSGNASVQPQMPSMQEDLGQFPEGGG